MKPYYQNELVTIYHGDCLEILPELDPVDLIITDPPYGMNYQSRWRKDKNEWKDKIKNDDKYPMWIFDLEPKNAFFAWCRWDNLYEIPKPKSFIVWDKCNHSMGDLKHEFGRQWEGLAFYPYKQHNFIKRPADLIRCKKISPEKLSHPTEKPWQVYLPILDSHHGIVLDLFMGTGSTLISCVLKNRKCIGIEIEEKYCEIAVKRCEQAKTGLTPGEQEAGQMLLFEK